MLVLNAGHRKMESSLLLSVPCLTVKQDCPLAKQVEEECLCGHFCAIVIRLLSITMLCCCCLEAAAFLHVYCIFRFVIR